MLIVLIYKRLKLHIEKTVIQHFFCINVDLSFLYFYSKMGRI